MTRIGRGLRAAAGAIVLLLACEGGAARAAVQERYDRLIAEARAQMLVDPHVTLSRAIDAEGLAIRQPQGDRRLHMQATAQWLRGEALIRLNDVDHAKPLIFSAAALATRTSPGSSLEGDALLSRGWINSMQAKPAAALADFQRAYAVFQQTGEVRSQAKALQSIGSLYTVGNDFEGALRYFGQALSIYKSDPMLALSLYNNRGNALKELGRYRDAERQYREALRLADQIGSPLLRVVVLNNIADVRLAVADVAGGQRLIDDALRFSTRGEAAGFRKQLYATDAQAAYQRRDWARAAELIGRRFAGDDLASTTLIDRDAHQTAYRIYRASGRDDLALAHLAALKRLDDEATDLARSTGAALMAARFDFANQELRIANLQRDEARRSVAFEQQRTRTQQMIFLGAAIALAIVIALLNVGLFTIRRSRNQVRAVNDDLAVTNTALGRALAAKTEFLATTSHEIRTPLNGILGMTQVMLADPAITGAVRERLGVVHSAGVTMRALVDDILDVAKMETGNLTIEAAPFDLYAMLVEASHMWREQARGKAIGFAPDLADCPRRIVGDVTRLRQIVFNLMSNALKFTATGAVTLRVAAVGARLHIVVADTGVGIAPDKCEEIFESFRQADTSTTRRFGGTGLGLAISRNLARAMGGDVAVESALGTGSRFTVDLPLLLADEGDPLPVRDGRPLMLVVDRNPITRNMLKAMLAPHVDAVEAVAGFTEAMRLIAAGAVAQLVIDGAAIDSDGAGFVALRAAAGTMPVAVLLAADATPPADVLAVRKPVSGADLVAALTGQDEQPLVSQAA